MKEPAVIRIVLLAIDGYAPVQVRIDNVNRYDRIRARLINYQEHHANEPDQSIPIISLDQMEKDFAVHLAGRMGR